MQPRLDLRLSQKLVMTPQLQQAIKLLQLSRLELQDALTQQLEENPMLEEAGAEVDEADTEIAANDETPAVAKTDDVAPSAEAPSEERDELASSWDEYFDDNQRYGDMEAPRTGRDEMPSIDKTMKQGESLEEHLLWQLALSPLDKAEQEVGRAIIGNLDEEGYLRTPLEDLAETTGTSMAQSLEALKVIQGFDPAGVAARDLKECLLLQIEQLGLAGSLVEMIVRHHLMDLERKRYPSIAKSLGVTVDAVVQATKIIEGLEPKPGRPFFPSDSHPIIPDVYVVKFQEPFFDHGVQYLRPMILPDVAEDVQMHESTISRVTSNKYLHCPQGILELKFFFNASIPRSQEGLIELSSVAVREMIRRMVEQED